MSLVFRVDADPKIGLGHLKRCLILAEGAQEKHIESRFVIFGSREAGQLAIKSGFETGVFVKTGFKEQLEHMNNLGLEKTDTVVMDFIHQESLSDVPLLEEYLVAIHARAGKSMLIDGGTSQSLRDVISEPSIDILLAPYIGEKPQQDKAYRSLIGTDFYILPAEFRNRPPRTVNAEVAHVLVTCGGSDPRDTTLLMIRALEMLQAPWKVTIVVGPLFSEAQRNDIAEAAEHSLHDMEIKYTPSSLAELMASADICLATSGLTKYELAATGTPSILVSIDAMHEKVNQAFLTGGTALSAGTIDSVTPDKIAQLLEKLAVDRRKRQDMADSGMRLIDGEGVRRILDAISGESSQQH